jgi:hypothetical protein
MKFTIFNSQFTLKFSTFEKFTNFKIENWKLKITNYGAAAFKNSYPRKTFG